MLVNWKMLAFWSILIVAFCALQSQATNNFVALWLRLY